MLVLPRKKDFEVTALNGEKFDTTGSVDLKRWNSYNDVVNYSVDLAAYVYHEGTTVRTGVIGFVTLTDCFVYIITVCSNVVHVRVTRIFWNRFMSRRG